MPRRPFSVPDEMACHFDTRTEPFNIHLEIRVPGRLEHQAFRTAAVAAFAANVYASSRRARYGLSSRRYAWEHPAALDRDPVSFTTVADDADLARTRAAFISRSPSVDVSPPASVLVASGPGYDHVILNAHHAAMDGLSWLDLLRDIGRRYRAATGNRPALDMQPAPAPPALAPVPGQFPSSRPAIRLPGPAPTRPGGRWPAHPARIARAAGGSRGYGLHLILMPGVPAVRPFATGDKATLNEALITALIVAIGRWNAERAKPARLVRITTPFNARATGDLGAAGNLSRLVTIAAPPPAPGVGPWPLLLDVAYQARRARRRPGPQVDAPTRGLAALYCPAWVKRLAVQATLRTAGPLVCDTAMLTNLGDVPDPPDFGFPGATMAFSAQAQMPRGLTVGAITTGGQLQLTLRYSRALFDQAAADRFAAILIGALAEITTGRDSDIAGNSTNPSTGQPPDPRRTQVRSVPGP